MPRVEPQLRGSRIALSTCDVCLLMASFIILLMICDWCLMRKDPICEVYWRA